MFSRKHFGSRKSKLLRQNHATIRAVLHPGFRGLRERGMVATTVRPRIECSRHFAPRMSAASEPRPNGDSRGFRWHFGKDINALLRLGAARSHRRPAEPGRYCQLRSAGQHGLLDGGGLSWRSMTPLGTDLTVSGSEACDAWSAGAVTM